MLGLVKCSPDELPSEQLPRLAKSIPFSILMPLDYRIGIGVVRVLLADHAKQLHQKMQIAGIVLAIETKLRRYVVLVGQVLFALRIQLGQRVKPFRRPGRYINMAVIA